MAEILSFKDGWKRRIDKVSETIEKQSENVDLKDPDGAEKMEAFAKASAAIAEDARYYAEMQDNEEKNAIERERNKIDYARDKQNAKSDMWKIIVSALGIIVGPLLAFLFDRYKENKRDERFKIASKFEENDAYIKTSQRKAVDEGLRDTTDSKGNRYLQFFK